MKALLTILAALSTLAAAQTAPYRVQAGDTAWSLARKHGMTVEALLQLNGLTSSDLRVGQLLNFNAATPTTPPPAEPAETATLAVQRGYAVYYVGRPDAATTLTAAHLTLPIGTWVRVTHERTGKSVVVKINDRGPFGKRERIIDLSMDAARELGIMQEGVAPVNIALETSATR